MRVALQRLLVDRFKLVVRHDTKELAMYARCENSWASNSNPRRVTSIFSVDSAEPPTED